MDGNKETEISYEYLKDIIRHFDSPVCLLGGWAVNFMVNELFEKEMGYPYLGSRDIDIGFNDSESLKKTMLKLTELGFRKVSFRFFKEIHSETARELSEEEAKITPLHYIFPIYIDLIIPKINATIKPKLGFTPIDEPMLRHAFAKRKYRTRMKKFGKRIIMPSPPLLLAMKINSMKERDKGHKKIKDLCDIVALCLYSGIGIEELKTELVFLLGKNKIEEALNTVTAGDIGEAAKTLGIGRGVIVGLISRLKD